MSIGFMCIDHIFVKVCGFCNLACTKFFDILSFNFEYFVQKRARESGNGRTKRRGMLAYTKARITRYLLCNLPWPLLCLFSFPHKEAVKSYYSIVIAIVCLS